MKRSEINLKLAILAEEGISTDILREAPPDEVILPPEWVYEVECSQYHGSKRSQSKILNEQLKNTRLNKCQKIEAAGILCGDGT